MYMFSAVFLRAASNFVLLFLLSQGLAMTAMGTCSHIRMWHSSSTQSNHTGLFTTVPCTCQQLLLMALQHDSHCHTAVKPLSCTR